MHTIDTVQEFNGAVDELSAGEMTHRVRDVLHDTIDVGGGVPQGPPGATKIRDAVQTTAFDGLVDQVAKQWMERAHKGDFAGVGNDAIVQRAALDGLSMWQSQLNPDIDPDVEMRLWRAVVKLSIAKAADGPDQLVHTSGDPGGVPGLLDQALEELNLVRHDINPSSEPLTRESFGNETVIPFRTVATPRVAPPTTGR